MGESVINDTTVYVSEMNPRIIDTCWVLELKRDLRDWFSVASLIWRTGIPGPGKMKRFFQWTLVCQKVGWKLQFTLAISPCCAFLYRSERSQARFPFIFSHSTCYFMRMCQGPGCQLTENSAHTGFVLKNWHVWLASPELRAPAYFQGIAFIIVIIVILLCWLCS